MSTCLTCHRPMRDRGVLSAQAPGTVRRHTADLCSTCHTRQGRQPRQSVDWWTCECDECGRGLRPKNSSEEEYPGRVPADSQCLCHSCGVTARRARGARQTTTETAQSLARYLAARDARLNKRTRPKIRRASI